MDVSGTDSIGPDIDLGERLERLFDAMHSQEMVVTVRQRALVSRTMFGFCEQGLAAIPAARIRGRVSSILANSAEEHRQVRELFDLYFDIADASLPIRFTKQLKSAKAAPVGPVVDPPPVLHNWTDFWLWGMMIVASIVIAAFVILNLDPSDPVVGPVPDGGSTSTAGRFEARLQQESSNLVITQTVKREILDTANRISTVLDRENPLTLSDISMRLYPPSKNSSDPKRWVRFLRLAVRSFSRPHNEPVYFLAGPSAPAVTSDQTRDAQANTVLASNFSASFAVLTAVVLAFEGRLDKHVTVTEIASFLDAESFRLQAPEIPGNFDKVSDLPSVFIASGALAAILSLLPLLAGGYWLTQRKDRARDYLRRRMPDIPPVMRTISIAAGDFNKALRDSAHGAAVQMLRRNAIATDRVDAGKTVSATIAQGGWLTPCYGEVLRRPEYLIVICTEGENDQNALRLDRLVDALKKEDVLTTRYFMDANSNRFFKSADDVGRTLLDLWFDYPEHRAIFVGTGSVFLRPGRKTPWPWAKDVQRWENTALLTPVDELKWRRKQAALSKLFRSTVQPATLAGFAAATRGMNSPRTSQAPVFEPQPFTQLLSWEDRPERWLSQADLEEEEWALLLNDLKAYFQSGQSSADGEHSPAIEWLCSCAVYPALNWDIALYLGLKLKGADGERYYSDTRASRLTNLPWFKAGYIPDPLRQRMLNHLKTHSPARHRAVVCAVADLLKGIEPGDGSRGDEFITLRVGQEPLSERHQKQMQRRQSRDVVLIDRLAEEDVTDLVVEVGLTWREKFEHVKDRYITREFSGLSMFIAYSAVVAVLVPWPNDGPLAINPWPPVIFFLLASLLCWLYSRRGEIVTVRPHA